MYCKTRGEITIREMTQKDVMPLVLTTGAPHQEARSLIHEFKTRIREKNEESNLLFVILYKGKVVGGLVVEFTDKYNRNPRYKGIKTDGDVKMAIPQKAISDKIADAVEEVFIELCREEGFVDVLGIPENTPHGGIT